MSKQDYYHVSLKAILKNAEGKILALKAVEDGSLGGFYDLPGGRMDEDEFATPFAEILEREIREEVGDVKFSVEDAPVALGRHLIPKENIRQEKDIHVLLVFFEAEYVEGDIKISDEHIGFEWIDLRTAELEKYFTSGILEGIRMYLKK